MRQLGGTPLDALRFIVPFRSSILGFHKTRITDAGFPVYDMAQWKAEYGEKRIARYQKVLDWANKVRIDKLAEVMFTRNSRDRN